MPELARTSARLAALPAPAECDRYRIGDGYLEVRSSDGPFRERLGWLYRECTVHADPPPAAPRIACTVRGGADDAHGLVTIQDAAPDAIDQADFILKVFPDRGYREEPSTESGWRLIGLDGAGTIAVNAGHLLVERGAPWRPLAGSLAVSRLIQRQPGLLFLHAASVAVRRRGLLIVGPKESGKTTLSLAMAARGHAFLGDEIAGVRLDGLTLVPVRRALAIRGGPRARRVHDALAGASPAHERFPDGTDRLRAQAGDLFPDAPATEVPLRHVIFLRGFAGQARLETVPADVARLRDLTPLGATLWGVPRHRRVRDLVALVAGTQAHALTLGDPDASARLVEQLAED